MSKLVFSEWKPLRTVYNGARASFDVLSSSFSSANALYEALIGAPAPAKSNKTVASHDHTEYGGGLPIHRGVIYSIDSGEYSGSLNRLIDATEVSTKVRFLQVTGEEPIRGAQDFFAYVTEGMKGSDSNRSSGTCVLEAKLIIWNQGAVSTGTATMYLRNETTQSETSFSVNILNSAPNIEEKHLTSIPLTGGWNKFTWWIDSPYSIQYELTSFVLAETLERSQRLSAGTNEYHNAGTRP